MMIITELYINNHTSL